MHKRNPSIFLYSNYSSELVPGEQIGMERKTKKEVLLEFKEKQKKLEAQEKKVNAETSSKLKKEIMSNLRALDSSQSSKAIQGRLIKRTRTVMKEVEELDELFNGPRPPTQNFPHFLIEKIVDGVGEKLALNIFFSAQTLENSITEEIVEGGLVLYVTRISKAINLNFICVFYSDFVRPDAPKINLIQECQRLKNVLKKERVKEARTNKSMYNLNIMLSKLSFKQRSAILEEIAALDDFNLEKFEDQRKRLNKRIEELQQEQKKEKEVAAAELEAREKKKLQKKRAQIKKKVERRINKRDKRFKSGEYFKYSPMKFKRYDYEDNRYRRIDYELANPLLKDKEPPRDEVIQNMLEEQKRKKELYSKDAIREHSAKIDRLIIDRKLRAQRYG